ncbi:hypothetical protein OFO01_04530 [Campylobacter sp. JMF_01 NE2]|uniref:DNA-processing protein DprA n=1 Tax=unclassified Campylobacter TaxID=2593542 RepID=UPI0022EA05B4|nr:MULTISPECIES: DNA-processing protein DprA [unclassified Campylobacter]MDA3052716.1 hypothetical protein [Campylobacter sp. JMF_03 NE3]MDA3067047.1 hypothetical protein [Campylobacter sp. JMF_01 NE2]
MVIALTGHVKIEKALSLPVVDETLRTYNEEAYEIAKKDIFNALKKEIPNIENEDVIFVSGMARGGDEIFADIAIELNKKLILCVPNSIKWHKRQKKSAIKYDEILQYNKVEVREIKKDYNGGNYHFGYLARNQAMVDLIDDEGFLLAFYRYNSSGVLNTIKRAEEANKKIVKI